MDGLDRYYVVVSDIQGHKARDTYNTELISSGNNDNFGVPSKLARTYQVLTPGFVENLDPILVRSVTMIYRVAIYLLSVSASRQNAV